MRFLIALACSLLLIALLAKPLKRHPVPFYLAAVLLNLLYFYGSSVGATGGLWPYFTPLMQRCGLAFVLFSMVMFIGVLRESSRLRGVLMPLRRQLSILACIFAGGHIVYYAAAYLPRITSTLSLNVAVSLGLAVLLVAVMALLLVTSFVWVKSKMSAAVWKKVQHLAYPFYLGIYLHLLLFLLPSALAGKDIAIISLSVYSVLAAAYVALRLLKSRHEGTPGSAPLKVAQEALSSAS